MKLHLVHPSVGKGVIPLPASGTLPISQPEFPATGGAASRKIANIIAGLEKSLTFVALFELKLLGKKNGEVSKRMS